jgi:hypothetical protein
LDTPINLRSAAAPSKLYASILDAHVARVNDYHAGLMPESAAGQDARMPFTGGK